MELPDPPVSWGVGKNGIENPMRVGCAFTIEVRPCQRIRANTAVTTSGWPQHRQR
jgi:hypothetical protein